MNHLKLFDNFQSKKLDILLSRLEQYNLDKDNIAIFGSAPLVVKGLLNDVNDLDVIVKPSSWNFNDSNEFRDYENNIEFFSDWLTFDIDDLIDNHYFMYKGYKFIDIEYVYQYKRILARSKDKDIWS